LAVPTVAANFFVYPMLVPVPPGVENNFFVEFGFNFLKLHIKVSSTLITAPSLSNSPQ
jgi:hypothetical protein